MADAEPVLLVLLYGSFAAASAALGALPFVGGRRPAAAWIGAAYALAGGAMLGVGYLLMERGLDRATISVVLGAVAGVAYSRWLQSYAGLEDLDPRPGGEGGVEYGYKILLQNTLHASIEGAAIGVAMALELRLGIFLALALAVHNVGEAMALTDVLRRRGVSALEAAGLAVVTNVVQPLLAVAVFALVPAFRQLFPAFLGFAAASLVFLALTELVPASYHRADARVVAFLVSAAAGAVVLLEAVIAAA